MATFSYYVDGELRNITTDTISEVGRVALPTPSRSRTVSRMASLREVVRPMLSTQSKRLTENFNDPHEANLMVIAPNAKGPTIMPTETVVLDGARKSDITWLESTYGFKVIKEGTDGKVLLIAPESGLKGVEEAFKAAKEVYEKRDQLAAHPNFIRIMTRLDRPTVNPPAQLWSHRNGGNPGTPAADVAAHAAWTFTKGDRDIKIAVLDEGVDVDHPALHAAVVGQLDVVDDNDHARPDGDDAHGTACAGIISSQNDKVPGLAPQCGLLAVRIAKGDGNDGWVFDDFSTADAIDRTWNELRADVLSNSWGGGPPVDVITRAFDRARTKGRNGKGAVVVIAAGNSNGRVEYPANLADVLAVGASNWFDELKSKNTQDGENWWGSCHGDGLDLLAPGVRISTCDISGRRGYSTSSYIHNYNGTSSAAPHVAAAAGLILSVRPDLSESVVRKILQETCDPVAGGSGRGNTNGLRRLNIYQAMRAALRA